MSIPADIAQRLINTGFFPDEPGLVETGKPATRPTTVSLLPTTVDHCGDAGGGTAPPLPAPPKMSIEDMFLALTALSSQISETRQQGSITEIQGNMAKQTEENQQRLQKLEEAKNKAEEAKKSGTWGKIFGWVASTVALIAGVVMMATGVGAVMGALMIAGAVLSMTNMALKEFAPDFMKDNKWLGITLLVAQIVVAVAGLAVAAVNIYQAVKGTAEVVVEAAEEAAEVAAEAAEETAEVAAEVAEGAVEATEGVVEGAAEGAAEIVEEVVSESIKAAEKVVSKAAAMWQALAGVAQGGISATQGVNTLNTADKEYDARNAAADAAKIAAELQKLQGALDEEMARLKKMMEEAEDVVSVCMSILNDVNRAKLTVISKQAV